MAKKNPLIHFEWRTRDAERLKQFYGAIFSWKFEEPMPGYTMVATGTKESGAGIHHIAPDQQIPPGVSAYFDVEDLDAYEEKVRAAGGNVMMSKQPVPGMGTFSVFVDPDGNSVGLWQGEPSRKTVRKAAKKAKKAAKKEAKKAKKAAKKGKR